MHPVVRVGMAEMAAIRAPGVLSTLGLGSCVAVCLYDPVARAAGLSHVMLPDSGSMNGSGNPGKFADTAIPLLIREMTSLGSDSSRLRAILVGGAEMFSFPGRSLPQLRIGDRNLEAIRGLLVARDIPVVAQSVGGKQGKSVMFDADNGVMKVKTLMGGDEEFLFALRPPAGDWGVSQ